MPKSNSTGGIHHFIMDKYSEALSHGQSLNSSNTNIDANIKDSLLRSLWDTLHESNRFVKNCQIIGRALEIVNNQNYPEDAYEPAEIAFTPEVIAQINETVNVPHLLDIASVTDDNIVGKRVVRFKVKGSNKWNSIPCTHEHIEPLSYPLLFLEGEDGWGKDIAKHVHFPEYIVSRMLMPEEGIYVRNAIETKWLPANRFQIFARIAQYWLVDCVSRNIDSRLDWVKRNQDYIFGTGGSHPLQNGMIGLGGEADIEVEPYDNPNHDMNEGIQIDDYVNNNLESTVEHENNNLNVDMYMEGNEMIDTTPDQPGYRESSGKTFLGSSFHGSRRHLRSLSTNGLVVVSEKGEPHLFITLTTNTEWPELKERLFYGQTAFDRLYQYHRNIMCNHSFVFYIISSGQT